MYSSEIIGKVDENGIRLRQPEAHDGSVDVQDHSKVVEMIRSADTLEEAIGLSIGAASSCWDNLEGAGVFESERAGVITETLVELVRDYVR